jgi:hypothetical protein
MNVHFRTKLADVRRGMLSVIRQFTFEVCFVMVAGFAVPQKK